MQNPSPTYEIPGFNWPEHYQLHSTKDQVFEYLNNFADATNVRSHIKFNHKVKKLEKLNPKGWLVKGVDLQSNKPFETTFDFVVVASGVYQEPQFPPIEDLDKFKGEVLHPFQVKSNKEKFEGKKVVVLGYGKSGLDLANNAVEYAQETTHVFRTAHWLIPRFALSHWFANDCRFIFGFISLKYILINRFASIFLGWFRPTWIDTLMHTVFYFITWLFWRMVEFQVAFQQGISKGHPCYPKHSIEKDLTCMAAVEPVGYFDAIRKGKLKPKLSTIKKCEEKAVILQDGTRIECDVLVLATGYKPDLSYMSDYIKDEKNFALYNHIIHPDIPDLAFIGFNAVFLFNGCVFISAIWIDAVLRGQIKLPSREKMLEKINRELEFKKKNMFPNFTNNFCLGPRVFRYFDELMDELGFEKRRKPFLLDTFMYYSARDYADLLPVEKVKSK